MNSAVRSWRESHAIAAVSADAAARRRLVWWMVLALGTGLLAGLATGATGFSPVSFWTDLDGSDAWLLLGQIRAPRTLGAALVGALLGLAGAIAQGVFRNPLADPYLLGSAAGAGLGVVLVLAGATLAALHGDSPIGIAANAWAERLGLVTAAFCGALAGVLFTLMLARGAVHTLRLLLAGVVVGVLLGAISDLVTIVQPDSLRGKQAFMLGSTGFLDWSALALMGGGILSLTILAQRYARALDALTLGEDSAASLGIELSRIRLVLVLILSLATALAVSQAGLIAFVGLVAPHLVRRSAPGTHAWLLRASAAMGAAVLLWADILSRALIAPEELPVGIVTAVLGGGYLVWLLKQGTTP